MRAGEKGALYKRSRARRAGTVRDAGFSSKTDEASRRASDARVERRVLARAAARSFEPPNC